MRVTIDIPDELYTAVQVKADSKDKADVNKRIRSVLKAFNDVEEKGDRYIILKGESRREVERILESTVTSGEELARKLKNLSVVSIGESTIEFNETEQRQIHSQAQFWSETPEVYIERVMREAFNTALGVW